jgi:hypothetical protein
MSQVKLAGPWFVGTQLLKIVVMNGFILLFLIG